MKYPRTVLMIMVVAVAAAVAQNLPTQIPSTDTASVLAGVPAPKNPGVIRLCLLQPKLEMGTAATPEALRLVLTQYLSGPQIEAVPITAMISVQVEAETRAKSCDYLLRASLSQKQSRRFGLLGGAQAFSNMVPVIGMAGRAGAVVGHAAAMTAISAANQLSSGVKAKSEVTLQYQLLAPGTASPIIADSKTAKAQADSQDVITPLVEQAATAVATAVLKK